MHESKASCTLAAAIALFISSATAADVTPEYLHGDWCQVIEINEEGRAPVVERHTWTIQPDGVFLRHFRRGRPQELTWTLDGNVLRVPMLGRMELTWVSEDEFHFHRFMLNRVVRGACSEDD